MKSLFESSAFLAHCWVILSLILPLGSFAQSKAIQETIANWGGKTFFKRGALVEVHLNEAKFLPGELSILSSYEEITDLSLEGTQLSEEDLTTLAQLPKLEWLNLYQTKIGNTGARILSQSKSIKLLPLGKSGINDQAMLYIGQMKQLTYLGLRGNPVTDVSAPHLANLTNLEGLYLGKTRVTDKTVKMISYLPRLSKLWLHDLNISDDCTGDLSKMSKLRELHLYATQITESGVRKIKDALPRCRVIHEAFPL